jgi:hypothetical protein
VAIDAFMVRQTLVPPYPLWFEKYVLGPGIEGDQVEKHLARQRIPAAAPTLPEPTHPAPFTSSSQSCERATATVPVGDSIQSRSKDCQERKLEEIIFRMKFMFTVSST